MASLSYQDNLAFFTFWLIFVYFYFSATSLQRSQTGGVYSGSLGPRVVDLLSPVSGGHAASAAAGDVRVVRRQRRGDDDGDDDDDRKAAAVVFRHGQAAARASRHLLPRTPVARGVSREPGERLQWRGQCTIEYHFPGFYKICCGQDP